MDITVLGSGYVGLTTTACLAHLGHVVTTFDPSAQRTSLLRAGKVPLHEKGLPQLLDEGLAAGRIRVSETAVEALEGAPLVLICVGTPLDDDGRADLSQVQAACGSIADAAAGADVVVRSTLPLGETASVGQWLNRSKMDLVLTNPEFLRQGAAVADFLRPTRIVIGTADGITTPAAERLLTVYAAIEAPILVTDFTSAEMIKNTANAFLATKLSFINEVADLCEAYGADVEAVVAGIGLDPRIGSTYLSPGIGFGGSCLPKELANLVRLGQERGLEIPLMVGAAQTNEQRASRIVDRIESLTGSVRGLRVGLLGVAFKPGTDDIRHSPSLAVASILRDRGADVNAHDPVVPNLATDGIPGIQRSSDPMAACELADLVILGTEWPEYLQLDWTELAGRVRRAVIFDGRNVLDAGQLRMQGWQVIQVGRTAT